MTRSLMGALMGALMLAVSVAALAQPKYPSRTVEVVVPYAPGGGTDNLMRMITGKIGVRSTLFNVDLTPFSLKS